MSMVMAVTAMAGFTSCSDDDAPASPTDLVLAADTRVKIGPENRVLLPIESGNGDYRAFSLAPEIADVVNENGQYYIEGFKNGTARVVVSDGANNYKQMVVSVYTTENMTLSHEEYTFVTPMGISSKTKECAVSLGNGGYTIESDNDKVVATIDPESGEITMEATSGKEEYVALVTVTDCSGLTATMNVTVTPTFDAFTQSDIDELMAATSNDYFIQCSEFPYNKNYDLQYYGESYHKWADEADSEGVWTFGLWEGGWYDYGGHYIKYPADAAINDEVPGTYEFKYNYSWSNSYPKYELEGTVKILKDDETSKVVIWWNVDMDNECINRGWIIKMK